VVQSHLSEFLTHIFSKGSEEYKRLLVTEKKKFYELYDCIIEEEGKPDLLKIMK